MNALSFVLNEFYKQEKKSCLIKYRKGVEPFLCPLGVMGSFMAWIWVFNPWWLWILFLIAGIFIFEITYLAFFDYWEVSMRRRAWDNFLAENYPDEDLGMLTFSFFKRRW